MPINGWYGGDPDNVTDDGNVNGWADQSHQAYGNPVAGGLSYRYGPVIGNYGTWGQLIYTTEPQLAGTDLANPTGLNGHMPPNNAPDNSIWVQGHLVNGECGGASNLPAYLTPISHNVNMWHAGREAVVQRLMNRGDAAGSMIIGFNPNAMANCRLIFRSHACPPPAGAFPGVPNGICVSLGVVIGGVMQSAVQVGNEFAHPGGVRWFADRYYGNAGAADRNMILEMIGGTEVNY